MSETTTLTPKTPPGTLGYRLPGQWEAHQATWLTWPRRASSSFADNYDAVLPVYARLVREVVVGEEVHINVWDAAMEDEVRQVLQTEKVPLERVAFHQFPAYEPWCRDHGPIFLVRDHRGKRERAVVDWGYNGWGGKQLQHDLDDAVPALVAQFRQMPLFTPGMVLEGGAFEVNGQGTLLATEACLLNQNRNPELNQLQIQGRLKDYLGVSNIIWLSEGLVGDQSDGRVDVLARFVNPTTIVVASEANLDDANFPQLQENLRRLRAVRDQNNRLFRIVKLPMPGMVESGSERLPASYLGFYIANAVVVVPTFRRAYDAEVLSTLRKEFPDRRVVGVDATELVRGLGSFHCITQQEPA